MQNIRVEGEQSVRRYDNDVARQVLARAADIEQSETLSTTQIEILGGELGLSAEAVRHALDEVGHKSHGRVVENNRQAETHGTFKAVMQASLGIALVLCIAYCIDFLNNGNPNIGFGVGILLAVSLFVLPMVFSILAGWRSRSILAGALRGLLIGFAVVLMMVLSIAASSLPDSQDMSVARVGITLYLLISSMLSGAIGGAIGQWRNRSLQSVQR